jgi:hypothetical protein
VTDRTRTARLLAPIEGKFMVRLGGFEATGDTDGTVCVTSLQAGVPGPSGSP